MATGEAVNTTIDRNVGIDVKPDALNVLNIILCIITNAYVFTIIRRQKELQEYMQVLYQILAISNTILGISWSIWNMLWINARGEKRSCAIISMTIPFVYHLSLLVKIGCLCGISFNLYVLVTRPLRYYRIVTRARFYSALGFSAAVILSIYGVYLPLPNSPFINLLTKRCISQNTMVSAEWISVVHTIFEIFPALATMLFTTIIHARLLCIAGQLKRAAAVSEKPRRVFVNHIDIERRGTHHDDRVGATPLANNVRDRPQKKRLKGFITILLLTGSFYIVWTPYVISYVIPMSPTFHIVLDRVAGFNTWLQPIIYLLTNPEARGLCLKSIRHCTGVISRP